MHLILVHFAKYHEFALALLRAGVTNWQWSGVAKFIFPVYKRVSEIIPRSSATMMRIQHLYFQD